MQLCVLPGLILITRPETAHNIPKMAIAICSERNQSCFGFVIFQSPVVI